MKQIMGLQKKAMGTTQRKPAARLYNHPYTTRLKQQPYSNLRLPTKTKCYSYKIQVSQEINTKFWNIIHQKNGMMSSPIKRSKPYTDHLKVLHLLTNSYKDQNQIEALIGHI